jgi:flagellin
MSLYISTNTSAAKANYYLGINTERLQKSIRNLASGTRLSSPVEDPGSLAVSMKLNASINRISGAMSNVQNGISFLEVQDGILDTVGKIIDRMSELKGLASQDPMKNDLDRSTYNNEFKDLQMQLYDISQMTFNGVSLFSNYTSKGTTEVLYNGINQSLQRDHTISIYTSENGSSGAKVSLHKSMLQSALTLRMDLKLAGSAKGLEKTSGKENGAWNTVIANQLLEMNGSKQYTNGIVENNAAAWVTLASPSLASTINLDQISVGIITSVLENISYLRAQNGGAGSRLNFAYGSLAQQKTNMKAAYGRIVDVDIAAESTRLAKYNVLAQSAAAMIAQANQTPDIALILLR